MPRLLLVDDNPSIHKIAETLLAHSAIDLVCVESAAEALDRLGRGERFDVALVDTAMTPMDGWALLEQLRSHPATAGIPIAMMAGVLDQVDPAQVESAPIQGFLKKPVELRELADRVQRLLETPMASVAPAAAFPASPFATMPATKITDLPEFRPQPAEARPEADLDLALEDFPPMEPVSDILDLSEEDLWPEPEAKVAPKGPDVVHAPRPGTVTEELDAGSEIKEETSLELEAFDLDSLKGLGAEAVSPAALPEPELESVPELEIEPELNLDAVVPDLGEQDEPTLEPEALAGLEGLGESLEAPAPDLVAAAAPTFDWRDESEDLLLDLPTLEAPGISAPDSIGLELPAAFPTSTPPAPPVPDVEVATTGSFEPLAAPVALPEPQVSLAPFAPAPEPAVPEEAPASAPVVETGSAAALVRALAADPVALDALARAVVARLGDQVLRDIAWEVMPDLAERLQQRP